MDGTYVRHPRNHRARRHRRDAAGRHDQHPAPRPGRRRHRHLQPPLPSAQGGRPGGAGLQESRSGAFSGPGRAGARALRHAGLDRRAGRPADGGDVSLRPGDGPQRQRRQFQAAQADAVRGPPSPAGHLQRRGADPVRAGGGAGDEEPAEPGARRHLRFGADGAGAGAGRVFGADDHRGPRAAGLHGSARHPAAGAGAQVHRPRDGLRVRVGDRLLRLPRLRDRARPAARRSRADRQRRPGA